MNAGTQQRPLTFADQNLLQMMLKHWPDTVLPGVPERDDELPPAPATAALSIKPSGAPAVSMLPQKHASAAAPAVQVSAERSSASHPPQAADASIAVKAAAAAHSQPASGSGEHVAGATRAAAAPRAAAEEEEDEVGAVIIRPELMQAPAAMVEDSMEARSTSPAYDTQPSSLADGDDGNSGSGSGVMPPASLGGCMPPVFVMTNCHSPNMCGHCGTHTTSGCWRRGWPLDQSEAGAMTEYINLCNKCGLRYKAGKLGPAGDVRDGAPTPPTPPPPPPRRTPPAVGPHGRAPLARAKPSTAAAALMAATEPMAGSLGTAGEVDDAFKSIRALLGSGRGYTLGAGGIGGAAGAGSPQAAAAAANLAAATAAELAAASRAQLALIVASAEPLQAGAKAAVAVANGREAHPRKRTNGSVSYDAIHANGAGAAGSAAGAELVAVGGDERPASRNRRRSKKAKAGDDVEPSDMDMADALLQLGNRHAQENGVTGDLLLSHETLDDKDQIDGNTVQPQPLPLGMHQPSPAAAATRQQRHVTHVVPVQQRNGRTKSVASSGGGAGTAGRTLSRGGAMQAAVDAAARQAAIAQRQALVAAWSTQDVQTWLSAAGCGEAAPLFASHGIDGPAMVGLVRLARDEAAGRLHGLLRQEVGLQVSLGQQLRLVDNMLSLFEPSK